MEDIAQCRALWSVLLIKYYSGAKIKKNEMGRACGMYWGQDVCIEGCGAKT